MNIEVNKALITVTVPKENAEELRKAICDAGAGVIGDYTYCTSNSITKGTFIPNIFNSICDIREEYHTRIVLSSRDDHSGLFNSCGRGKNRNSM